MRNLGVIFILALIGMAAWRASDRYQPVLIPQPQITKVDQAIIPDTRPRRQVENSDQTLQIVDSLVDEIPASQKESTIAKSSLEVKGSRFDYLEFEYQEFDYQESEPDPLDFDRVVIPSLKVNANMITKSYSQLTWNLTDLGQDIAVLEDIPEQQPENNVILAGHVTVYDGSNGPFRYLWKLDPGQQIILFNDQFKYTYTVRDQVLVYPDERSVLEDTAFPQLTLITCTTWDEETLSYLRRRVIFADLEQIEERTDLEQIKERSIY